MNDGAVAPGGDLEIETAEGGLILRGDATLAHLGRLRDALSGANGSIDISEVDRLDSAGSWALVAARDSRDLRIFGGSRAHEDILDAVSSAWPKPDPEKSSRRSPLDRLEALGRKMADAGKFFSALSGYLGLFLARLFASILHPKTFRFTALAHHCQDVGLKAVPIVALMAFLIGIVLAFQGAAQLRQFGAEVFVVDLIAVSVLRELGVLLTAIIVAGRTASSFTAAIGSMKMREEVDAMRTLGVDPADALIVPRVLALLLMLPILGLIADVSGLLGGALMSWLELGISPAMFRTRLVEGTDVAHVFVGLVKTPVFALIIGIVGCHAGMQVKGNAESLGIMTSKAVVTAIFMVIVADALFSIFFAELGI
ncbi:phospholipid/cholesterol/gamma-HCH transport system permease protein [Poseidonocella pacifica]|uniref:Phospholipid/cholesterol/gamma-HCH transport system permease protein n=1 Tax=Poseidonocella pacifica TaxID=871651 RepID=A0A1I0XD29_9RHOB|nr:ABC transporter permease [Poseidonocella pacifica]SFA98959.1 phospholipid/cholesterol/gamma-HCH transport system permease protein [Poseidonocella pacifica]